MRRKRKDNIETTDDRVSIDYGEISINSTALEEIDADRWERYIFYLLSEAFKSKQFSLVVTIISRYVNVRHVVKVFYVYIDVLS